MTDAATGEKIRLRFQKTDNLRLLSHHDLMRCVERMLRRAQLPFRMSQGFHPSPRVVFALSLPLGVAGVREVVEIEFQTPHAPDDVLARLQQQSPVGLTFTAARVVPLKACAVPRRAEYQFQLPPDRVNSTELRCRELLALEKIWVDKYHPRPRRVNIRPYLRDLRLQGQTLIGDVWVTGQGSARAEDLLTLLGLTDLLAGEAILERTELEIHDEVPPEQPDGPPEGPPETARLDHVPATAADADGENTTDRRASWGLSPNGPVVE
ncbi:MAG: TIGR03936 family radical SAM-associated protein [Bacteroidales bacterium]|nr:TIGR03936 family radical SAM-associated protein [Bacteroidales bacterium]